MKDNLRTTIRAKLHQHRDPEYQEKISALVPSNTEILGVRVPVIRQLATDFFQAEKATLSMAEAQELVDSACQHRCREEMLFAIFVLAKFKKNFTADLWRSIDRWVDAVENWETCDQLSSQILIPVLLQDMQHMDDLVRWTKSANLWRRRITAATMASLNHGKRRYPQETFRICENLMTDQEPMVYKAVGWALRDTSNECPQEVQKFLKKWKPKITKSLLRESAKKLPLELRNEL